MNVTAWVIPWYREQDWPDWCSLFNFKGSHKDWLLRAEAGARAQARVGRTVAKVVIEPRKFLDWTCIRRGSITAEERMAYAISLVDALEGAEMKIEQEAN